MNLNWKKTADITVCGHVDKYVGKAKHTEFILGTDLDGDGVLSAIMMTKEDERGLYQSAGVLALGKSSGKKFHKEGKKKYRLQKLAIRRALYGATGGKWSNLTILFTMNKDEIAESQKAFCEKFHCRLVQKPQDEVDDTSVYTNGDWFEYETWCRLGENPENWHKNSRCYTSGTDCAQYEIKSAYWAGSSVSPLLNQYI